MIRFVFLLLTFNPYVFSQSSAEIFNSVFGQSKLETKLELIVQGQSLGDIKVQVMGDSIVSFESEVLDLKLKAIVKEKSTAIIRGLIQVSFLIVTSTTPIILSLGFLYLLMN